MTPSRQRCLRWSDPGFSLVELLIAASLTATLLAASWSWVWTTASAARRVDAAAQHATGQGFAARMVRADLARCVRLGLPDEGVCGPARVTLVCRDPLTGADELVVVAWDAQRGVLWRKAPGSYLAEGVGSCLIGYFTRDGDELVPVNGVLSLTARRSVARVRVEWRAAGDDAPLNVVDGVLPVPGGEAPDAAGDAP